MSGSGKKDEVLTLTQEEFNKEPPGSYQKFFEPYEQPESVLPDGRINVECPCLHSALAHRCGFFIREAVKCFNASNTEPRGMDCDREFIEHVTCMDKYK